MSYGEANKMWFKASKFFVGVVITFFPFGFNSPFKEIIASLGALIILSSGLKVQFSPKEISIEGKE